MFNFERAADSTTASIISHIAQYKICISSNVDLSVLKIERTCDKLKLMDYNQLGDNLALVR